mgnify:CR=1 FL=1
MKLNKLLKKAQELILAGRTAKTKTEKDEALDGLWELIINMEYELKHRRDPSPN